MTRRYQRLIPGARLVTIAGAGHFVFMPTCTLPGRIVAAQVCVDANDTVDRSAVHVDVSARAIRFFDRALTSAATLTPASWGQALTGRSTGRRARRAGAA